MKKNKFFAYLGELLIVMFGVFLGMMVSDCNSERKLNANRKIVLKNIKQELLANKEQIQQDVKWKNLFLNAQDSLDKTLTEAILAEKFYARPFSERLPNWKGIGVYRPDHAMFDAAKFSNVMIGMDVDLLAQLSKIYSRQEDLKRLHGTFLNRFYQINAETRYSEVNRLVWQIRQELWGNQFLLTKEYDQLIELIEQHL